MNRITLLAASALFLCASALPAQTSLPEGSVPVIAVPHRQSIGPEERTLSFDVAANVDYTAATDAEWATVQSREGGIYLHAADNDSYAVREAHVTFSNADLGISQTLTLTQEGKVDALVDFFTKSIAGIAATYTVSQPIGTDAIQAARDSIWEAWRGANNLYDEEKLIPLVRLSQTASSSWKLPSNLEANATLNYRYGYKGATKPKEGYPLFIYLHGSGDRDSEWATGLSLALAWDDSPSVYFIPQIPNTGEWYRWWQKSKQWAWEKLLRQAFTQDYINPDRVYVLGISEGGYGGQRLASFYADYWAAAGPMAGGEPLKNAPPENLLNTPFSLRTGSLDSDFFRNELTTYTKEALDELQQQYPDGYEHWVTLINGSGHGIDYSPTAPWLKKYTRNACPTRVHWEDYEMDGLHRSGFANLEILERPNSAYRTYYEENIADNTVSVTVQNVDYTTTETESGIEKKFEKTRWDARYGKFRIYLNEDMVDLSRSVRVVVNGTEYCNEVLTPDVQHLVRSAARFFDPRRLFPACVEIDIQP